MGPALRRRPGTLAHAQPRARRGRPGACDGTTQRAGGDRARLRLAGGRLVRAGTPRCLPVGGADERTVRRPAGAALRYGRRHAGRSGADARRRLGPERRAGRAAASAQALPVVLLDPRGRWRHAQLSAGRARVPARVLPPQERRLGAEPAVSARALGGVGTREDADLLRDGSRRDDAADGGTRDADRRTDRCVPLAARRRDACVQHRIHAHRLPGRTAVVSLRHERTVRVGDAVVRRPPDRCAVELHRRQQRLGCLPEAGRT